MHTYTHIGHLRQDSRERDRVQERHYIQYTHIHVLHTHVYSYWTLTTRLPHTTCTRVLIFDTDDKIQEIEKSERERLHPIYSYILTICTRILTYTSYIHTYTHQHVLHAHVYSHTLTTYTRILILDTYDKIAAYYMHTCTHTHVLHTHVYSYRTHMSPI